MTTDNFCFYLLNRLIQTSETGGQLASRIDLFRDNVIKRFAAVIEIS